MLENNNNSRHVSYVLIILDGAWLQQNEIY